MFIKIWPCKKNGSKKDTKKDITILRKEIYSVTQDKMVWQGTGRDQEMKQLARNQTGKTVSRKKTWDIFCSSTHVK
jgi:hypothetical protein